MTTMEITDSTIITLRPREEMETRLNGVLDSHENTGVFDDLTGLAGKELRFDELFCSLSFGFRFWAPTRPFPILKTGAAETDQLLERFVKLLVAALVDDVGVQRDMVLLIMPEATVVTN